MTAPPTSPWREHAEGVLRRSGHRSGAARLRVVEALAERDCCISAAALADELRAADEAVGIASVYRALELLVRLGLVRRLEVGDGTARYEAAQPGGEHHHHVVCDDCGRVEQFSDDRLEQAIDGVAGRLAFRIDAHDVVLRGTCPRCRPAAAR
jgi:Fur family ferric uptake transcriptional regulator